MSKLAPTLLFLVAGAFSWWLGATWPQERDPTPLLAAAAASIVVGVLILLLLTHAARDPGRDSTAVTRSRTQEKTSAVYIVWQSPSEQHHYHHYDGKVTVRHEHSGAVQHEHTHQHSHTLAAADNYGSAPPRRSLSPLDSPAYAPPRIVSVERPPRYRIGGETEAWTAPRQLEAHDDDW